MKSQIKDMSYGRVHSLLALPPETPIRIYSYQDPMFFHGLAKNGYMSGDEKYIRDTIPFWLDAYEWMREQMARLVPEYSGDYPVWAWPKRQSTHPNATRKARGIKERYRVTALVPRKRIVFSDYNTWHSPLNGSPALRTEKASDDWDDNVDPRSTWSEILNFTPPQNKEEMFWLGGNKKVTVQCCVDRIYQNEIVNIKDISKGRVK